MNKSKKVHMQSLQSGHSAFIEVVRALPPAQQPRPRCLGAQAPQDVDEVILPRSVWTLKKEKKDSGYGQHGIVTSRHSVLTAAGNLPVVRFRMYMGGTATAVQHFDRETFLDLYELEVSNG